MEAFLKSFPLGFLLRSAFSGVFFVVSFCAASPNLVKINSDNIFSIGLPFALIAGVIVYGLHRSLIYPWIEWALNANWAKNLREKCLPLISKNSIKTLADSWDAKSNNGKDKLHKRGEQLAVWADYAHLQYASSLCIILGAFSSTLISDSQYEMCRPLFWLIIIFAVAAFVSDWRWHSVQQLLPSIVEDENPI